MVPVKQILRKPDLNTQRNIHKVTLVILNTTNNLSENNDDPNANLQSNLDCIITYASMGFGTERYWFPFENDISKNIAKAKELTQLNPFHQLKLTKNQNIVKEITKGRSIIWATWTSQEQKLQELNKSLTSVKFELY